MHEKFNCITVYFDRTQPGIYTLQYFMILVHACNYINYKQLKSHSWEYQAKNMHQKWNKNEKIIELVMAGFKSLTSLTAEPRCPPNFVIFLVNR